MSNINQLQSDVDTLYQSVWDAESNQLKLVQNSRFEELLDRVKVTDTTLFPSSRITYSTYKDSSNNKYAIFGLLDNAYHPTLDSWTCESNMTYSWFVGLRVPLSDNVKDNANASFIIMYNDTDYNSEDESELDVSEWHIVFAVDVDGVVDLS